MPKMLMDPSKTPKGLLEAIYGVSQRVNRKFEDVGRQIEESVEEDDSTVERNFKKAAGKVVGLLPWVNPVPENDLGLALSVLPVGAIASAAIKPLTAPVKKVLSGLRAQEAPVPLQKILNLLKKEGLKKTELEDSGVLEFPTTKGNVKPREMLEKIDEVAPRIEPTYSDDWATWTPETYKGTNPKVYEHSQYYLGNRQVPRPELYKEGHLNFGDIANYPVAHSRSSQLFTEKGEPTRYVSEVQSDLHQAAAKLGYTKGKKFDELSQEEKDAVWALAERRRPEIEDLADNLLGPDSELGLDDLPVSQRRGTPQSEREGLLRYLSHGASDDPFNSGRLSYVEQSPIFKEMFPHGFDAKTKQALEDLDKLNEYGSDSFARQALRMPYERYVAAKKLAYRLSARADSLRNKTLSSLERQTHRHPFYGDKTMMDAAKVLEPELAPTQQRFYDLLSRSTKLSRLEELKERAVKGQHIRGGFWNYLYKEPQGMDSLTRIRRPGQSIWDTPLFRNLRETQRSRARELTEAQDAITELLFKAEDKAAKLVDTGYTPFIDVVPDIPFKQTWERQALKDELRRAVDRGETRLAIARPDDLHPGVQPKAHFDNLQYDATTGILSGVVRKTGKPFTQPVPPEKLPGYVGDTVAEELLQTGRSAGENVLKPGFRIFYEQKLPNEFEDILRRHGIEPERTDEVLGHLQDTPQQNREISRNVLAEILPNEPRLEEIAAQLGYGTAQVTELLDDVLNTPVFQRNNIVTPDMLRDSNNFFYDILTSDDLTALTSAANKYKQLFQQRLQTPRFKSLTRPTPTYNITNPAILDMVKQGFPLGALAAGILGLGAYENKKAQGNAILGL